MKRIFEVEIRQRVRIEFESSEASEASAVHVGERCVMRCVPDKGRSRTVGDWSCELVQGEVKSVVEVRK